MISAKIGYAKSAGSNIRSAKDAAASSAAIITDAFPSGQGGFALGIKPSDNQLRNIAPSNVVPMTSSHCGKEKS